MNVPPANSSPGSPAKPAPSRGTQYAACILAAVAVVLVGFRYFIDRAGPRPTELKQALHRIELNTATRSELMQLPGIGPGRADKILAYRELNGGFQRVEDLRSVNGIGDITLQRLKPLIHVENSDDLSDEPMRLVRKPAEPPNRAAKTVAAPAANPSAGQAGSPKAGTKKTTPDSPIDINQASTSELQRLPGIGPSLAQRIIEQRQRQPFASVDDLRKVSGIGVKKLEQVRPFVVVQN